MLELVITYVFVAFAVFLVKRDAGPALIWPFLVLKFFIEIFQGIIGVFAKKRQ